METNHILQEITPLQDKDVFYIGDRTKAEFTYPLHKHEVFELNFIENAAGARRLIGDSNEEIREYDLVIITGANLEHIWKQGKCTSKKIREITIHFQFDLSDQGTLSKTPFLTIRDMLRKAQNGLSFPMSAILKVYPILDELSEIENSFYCVMQFMKLLYELSLCEDARPLASSSYARVEEECTSRRVAKVKKYINMHYMEEIRLGTLADLVGMSESAFSRFFKTHTGKKLSEYIIDIRLGYASRMLIETSTSIAEISFKCGFNNLSNFNRIFKKYKGCSPTEFKENYKDTKAIEKKHSEEERELSKHL